MLYQDLVERNADRFINEIITDIYASRDTDSYLKFTLPQLYKLVRTLLTEGYTYLDGILTGHDCDEEIHLFFATLGRERYSQGIPLNEAVKVIMFIKKRLHAYVDIERIGDSPYGLQQLNELNFQIGSLTNRAVKALIAGYEEAFLKGYRQDDAPPLAPLTSYAMVANE